MELKPKVVTCPTKKRWFPWQQRVWDLLQYLNNTLCELYWNGGVWYNDRVWQCGTKAVELCKVVVWLSGRRAFSFHYTQFQNKMTRCDYCHFLLIGSRLVKWSSGFLFYYDQFHNKMTRWDYGHFRLIGIFGIP